MVSSFKTNSDLSKSQLFILGWSLLNMHYWKCILFFSSKPAIEQVRIISYLILSMLPFFQAVFASVPGLGGSLVCFQIPVWRMPSVQVRLTFSLTRTSALRQESEKLKSPNSIILIITALCHSPPTYERTRCVWGQCWRSWSRAGGWSGWFGQFISGAHRVWRLWAPSYPGEHFMLSQPLFQSSSLLSSAGLCPASRHMQAAFQDAGLCLLSWFISKYELPHWV